MAIQPYNNEVVSGNEGNEIAPQTTQGGNLEARVAALEAKIAELEAALGGQQPGQPGLEQGLEEARALFPSLNK
jgi:hypothetical protein